MGGSLTLTLAGLVHPVSAVTNSTTSTALSPIVSELSTGPPITELSAIPSRLLWVLLDRLPLARYRCWTIYYPTTAVAVPYCCRYRAVAAAVSERSFCCCHQPPLLSLLYLPLPLQRRVFSDVVLYFRGCKSVILATGLLRHFDFLYYLLLFSSVATVRQLPRTLLFQFQRRKHGTPEPVVNYINESISRRFSKREHTHKLI